jgi:hypothetical protein
LLYRFSFFLEQKDIKLKNIRLSLLEGVVDACSPSYLDIIASGA